jgi:hypothetical protein
MIAASGGLTLFAACGSDETQAPADDHTPVSYSVLINDVVTDPPFTLAQGQTVRIRLKFLNAAGDDLDDVEGEHFAGLTFEPTTLATAARLSDHHYQFDVTGGTAGTGTVQVGFGHDELADETSFTPVAVTVTAP